MILSLSTEVVKYSGSVAEGIRGNSGKRSTEERSSEEFAEKLKRMCMGHLRYVVFGVNSDEPRSMEFRRNSSHFFVSGGLHSLVFLESSDCNSPFEGFTE
jgi:hypothetical protein